MVSKGRITPILLELIGIITIGSGIGIELAMRADMGYYMITMGSVMVAIGGVIFAKRRVK